MRQNVAARTHAHAHMHSHLLESSLYWWRRVLDFSSVKNKMSIEKQKSECECCNERDVGRGRCVCMVGRHSC
jgi:hypothetical protein